MSQTKAQLIDPVDGSIVNADINASAAIAGSKISPDFGSQNIVTTGTLGAGTTTVASTSATPAIIQRTSSTANVSLEFKNDTSSMFCGLTSSATGFAIDDDNNLASGPMFFVQKSDGNVGIGTTSPAGTLSLSSQNPNIRFDDSDTANNAEITLDNTHLRIEVDEDNARSGSGLSFRIDGSDKAVIDSSGNVGIGTSSPGQKLGVSGNIRFEAADPTLEFNNGGAMVYARAANTLQFASGGGPSSPTERMRIDSNGNVGIGTSSPGSELHVSALGASDEPTIRLASENSTIFLRTAGSSGSFPTGGVGNDGELTYVGGDFRLGAASASKNLMFFTGGYTERLRIDSSGNVGIGTTNPQRLLHQHVASSAANYHSFTNTTTGSSATDGLLLGINSSEEAIFWNYENTAMEFATNGAERMRISSSGNVGIGDSNPDQKLVVQGSGTTILKVENTDDGTAQITLGNTGSSNLGLKQNNGETAFDIGGVEKMRIRGDGLCIGTTTHSSSGNRLTIQATSSENLAHFNKLGTGNKSILSLQHGRATGSTVGNGIIFRNSSGTNVGEIEITNSEARTVGFSDYRMKENIADITNGINSVKNLAPKTFNYIQDENKKVKTGFIAHEIQAVLPQAVTGDKDAVVTQALIDSDDVFEGEVGDPIYQKVCITDLIPTLTAALKEAITKIETLETKVAALEAA